MNRLILSVALLWSTPALAYPYLIGEEDAAALTEVDHGDAACSPDPTPMVCTHDYSPVRIRISATEYCMFANDCSAQSAGFDPLPTSDFGGCLSDNEELTTDLDTCEDDVVALTGTLTECEGVSTTVTVDLLDCQGDVVILTADLGDCTVDLGDCTADLADAQASVAARDGEIASLAAEVAVLETENSALETENSALTSENSSLTAQIADLEAHLDEGHEGECGCSTTGFGSVPGAALLVALGLARRRRVAS